MFSQQASSIDLLNAIHRSGLKEVYPDIEIALRLFLTLPVTVATCESFSKLKLIKNYLRSSMSQDRLSRLALISIEHDAASRTDYDDVIDTFACANARIVVV